MTKKKLLCLLEVMRINYLDDKDDKGTIFDTDYWKGFSQGLADGCLIVANMLKDKKYYKLFKTKHYKYYYDKYIKYYAERKPDDNQKQ